jgi:UDP-glucose 4-epimerase
VKVAVTGGTGFVGHALLDEAACQGVAVRALARREQRARDGVEWLTGDLADKEALAALVSEVDAVLHIAGVVNTPDPMGFHLGNVVGTEALLDAACAAGVQRFVFVSSLAARAPGLSKYGKSKRHAEEAVQTSGLDWTIVRPPAIYGPRDREILDMFRAAKWGVVPMPPPGHASMIHVEDLARLLLALAPSGEDVTHRVFEPDDERAGGWSHRELAQAIGSAVGRRPWVPHLSQRALTRFARVDRLLRGRRAKLTPDRIGYMCHPDWVCRPEYKPPASRWQPRIATSEGLKATAVWYREQGWI